MTKLFNKYTGKVSSCAECDVLEITNDVLNKTADFYLSIPDKDFENLANLDSVSRKDLVFIQIFKGGK